MTTSSSASAATEIATASQFDRDRHIKYFSHHLLKLPFPYSSLDTNRLTLVHFAVHALDMLGVWDDDDLVQKLGLNKQQIIDWIYGLQVTEPEEYAGFKGGTFLGGAPNTANNDDDNNSPPREFNHGHIAMTYTALCTLAMLGDDFQRIAKDKILKAMKRLQRTGDDGDGSFQSIFVGSESDARFLYCACCISHMLNDWSGVDIDRAVEYVRKCRSFDGAIGALPGKIETFAGFIL